MKTDILGSIVSFSDNRVTIEIDTLTPELILSLQECLLTKKTIKFTFQERVRKTLQYYQLKFWYGFLRKVLIKLETSVTAETLSALDEICKRSCLPGKSIPIGVEVFPYVPRKRDLSREEMEQGIEKLLDRYEYLSIDYSDLGR